MSRPLLAQIAELHGISVRDFAALFDVSKTYAAGVLNHTRQPSLEVAVRISRYFEVTVEELFGWWFDDNGERRPLLIQLPGTDRVMVLKSSDPDHATLKLVKVIAQALKDGTDLLTLPAV